MIDLPPRDPIRTFFGYVLVAVGGLMTALCGLCTATFMVAAIVPGGDKSFFVMALVIGGIPTGIGVALFMIGRSILHRGSPPEPPHE